MRTYSLFSIVLLCLAILFIDVLTFYWLQSITEFIPSTLFNTIIHSLFWIFTIGLILAIVILKVKLDDINPRRKQLLISALYGLTISSFVPKIFFVIVISILFFGNYILSGKESLIIVPFVGILSGFLPFFIIVYAIFKAVYHFKVHRHKIQFLHLPMSFDGLKIVHISDLHLGGFNYRYKILKRAVDLINSLQPDLIFFTGDLVNNYAWELIGWNKVFKNLIAKKGKYAVLGNHDYGDYSEWDSKIEKKENFDKIKRFYDEIDFKLLLNEAELINISDECLAIIGVENWGKPPFKQYGDLGLSLKHVSTISFKILLSHDPTHWNEEVVNKTDIALTLSGHTHGMQAAIKLINKTWSPIKYKYEHWAGLYKQHHQFLYVNRGLGWIGFPGRLGMRPEITLLELKCSNKSL